MPSKEELRRIADELQRLAKLLTGEGSPESDTPVTGPQAVAESEPVPDWLKRARALLKDRIELPKGSHLTLGLAPGGSALVEQGDPDGGQLPVPEGPGPWVVGWLDPEPERMFGHPVQLLWLHLDTKQLKIRNSMFPPMLKVAGPAVPFSGGSVVPDGGAQIVWGHGHIGVGWPVSISSPSQIPSFIPNWPAVLGPCQKTALVIDLGDSSRYFGLRGTMADDADKMGAWLRGQNFSVRRISQDDRSPHPSLRRSRMRATLISEIAARLSTLPIVFPPGRCCHEFFLYIKAHGYKRRSARPASGSTPTGSSRPGGLGMYSRDGNRHEHIDFFTLLSPLATR